MKKQKNLIPINKRPINKQKAIARKGGIMSGKARKERKLFKDIFINFLDKQVTDAEDLKLLKQYGMQSGNYKELLAVAVLNKALTGDIRATEFIINIIGEKPKEDDANTEVLERLDELLKKQSITDKQ